MDSDKILRHLKGFHSIPKEEAEKLRRLQVEARKLAKSQEPAPTKKPRFEAVTTRTP